MTTKIAIKSGSMTPFGGLFYAMDEFSRLGLDNLIDKYLGLRSSCIGYQYSEIISNLFWIYYCGVIILRISASILAAILSCVPVQKFPVLILYSEELRNCQNPILSIFPIVGRNKPSIRQIA